MTLSGIWNRARRVEPRFDVGLAAVVVVSAVWTGALGTLGGNLCLDTRCIYYNQSEWWRRANAYCLKNRGDICHVAPKGERCHAAFSGDLAPALLVLLGTVAYALSSLTVKAASRQSVSAALNCASSKRSGGDG